MITNLLYSFCGILLFGIGLFALIACAHPLRKILSINIMSTGVFLVFIAAAYRADNSAGLDPVPHAMVLTGIVVSVSVTALALILACKIQETSNRFALQNRKKTGKESA